MMRGWMTWLAAIATAALGIVDIFNDQPETGITKITLAFGMVGIGRKIEKKK